MKTPKRATSEVAQILTQIQAEYESGMRGLCGLAEGATKHQFITARMERIDLLHSTLGECVGEEQAMQLLVSALADLSDPPSL
ncbi:MAG TPA: hypothetical protein VGF67_23035 [Ktedonobacteraceae bacterium]|jgi:hypothetical protein